MRKASLAALLLLAGFGWIPTPTPASACGDKFLVIGRGVKRVPKASHPAAIVLYLRTGSPVAAAAKAMRLESSLKQAGHKVDVVTDDAALREAMASRRPDFVIADLPDAEALARAKSSGPSQPAIVPLVGKTAKTPPLADYELVIVSGKSLSYLAALDSAMARRTVASR